MPELRLEVWDVTNASQIRALSKVYDPVLADSLWVPGNGALSVDLDSSDDLAALEFRRKVRWFLDDNLAQTTTLADRPTVIRDAGERPSLRVSGPTLLGDFGYDKGGGALWPEGGLSGDLVNPRRFGFADPDFDDGANPEPDSSGRYRSVAPSNPLAGTLPGFPDLNAEWIGGDGPVVWLRRLHDVANAVGGSKAGKARVYLSANTDFDYELGSLTGSGRAFEITQRAVTLPAAIWPLVIRMEDDLVAPRAIVTIVDLNDNGTPKTVLYRSWTTAVTGGGDPNRWEMIDNPNFTPGVTVGFIAGVGYDESKARSALAAIGSRDFDEADDSAGQPWQRTFAHEFQWSRLGMLWDQLQQWEGEVNVTPQGVFQYFIRRGQDRTATVSFTLPYQASLTGEGPIANQLLYETPHGAGQATDAPSVAAYTRLEDVVTFGTGVDVDALGEPVTSTLLRNAHPHDETTFETKVVTDLLPYVNVFLGDDVTAVGRAGDASFRLTRWTLGQDDTGLILLSASAVPS